MLNNLLVIQTAKIRTITRFHSRLSTVLFFFLIIVITLTIQAVFGVALIAHAGEMAVGQLELVKHQTRRDSGAK